MARFERSARHTASRTTILVSAAVAVLFVAGLSYLAAVAPRGVPGVKYYELTAQFEDSADIRLLSAVSVSGRRVGQISKIESKGGVAELTLQMKSSSAKLLSDSTARIRLKNPVGAKYVEITPGKAGAVLETGATLPVKQTSAAVDTPELLSGFPEPTRKDLSSSVEGLGKGFLGRGEGINDILPQTAPMLRNAAKLSDAILARQGAAARLAPSLEQLADAYEPVREQVAAGFRPQAEALEAFGNSRTEIQEVLDVAPPALTDLRTGLDATRPLLAETAGFARATSRLTKPAPDALREATLLFREGAPALNKTRPLLDDIGTAVPPTLGLLQAVDPVLDPSRKLIGNQFAPLREFGTRSCDVLEWAKNWRSALSYGVPTGGDPASDLDASQGLGPNSNSFRVLAVPPTDSQSLNADAPGPDIKAGRSAYPAPCTAGSEVFP